MEHSRKFKVEISAIKKSFFNLTLRKQDDDHVAVLSFRDVINYNAPCSLDNYLKTWNGEYSKSIFPYTFFKSVEELKSYTEFPPKEAFYSDLKQVRFVIQAAVHTAAHTVVHTVVDTAVQTAAHTVVHTVVDTAAHTAVHTAAHTEGQPNCKFYSVSSG